MDHLNTRMSSNCPIIKWSILIRFSNCTWTTFQIHHRLFIPLRWIVSYTVKIRIPDIWMPDTFKIWTNWCLVFNWLIRGKWTCNYRSKTGPDNFFPAILYIKWSRLVGPLKTWQFVWFLNGPTIWTSFLSKMDCFTKKKIVLKTFMYKTVSISKDHSKSGVRFSSHSIFKGLGPAEYDHLNTGQV
jgi:hypothetical protein